MAATVPVCDERDQAERPPPNQTVYYVLLSEVA
jgi:hypothetical protein